MLNINSHQKNYRLKNVKTYLISSVVINENKDQLIFACHACNAEDPSSIPGSGSSAGGDIGYPPQYSWASLVAQLVKNPPAMQEIWVHSLGWEDPLDEGKATCHGMFTSRIPVCCFLSLLSPLFLISSCQEQEEWQATPRTEIMEMG